MFQRPQSPMETLKARRERIVLLCFSMKLRGALASQTDGGRRRKEGKGTYRSFVLIIITHTEKESSPIAKMPFPRPSAGQAYRLSSMK